MDIGVLVRGILLGLSIAAPVGPIGMLCIRRTLTHGPRVGFVSGLGAATADALYGGVAGFGLTAVAGLLLGYQSWLTLFGGLYLCYLGISIYQSRPAANVSEMGALGLARAYASTFLLTLTNPATIFSFTAIFAGFVGDMGADYAAIALLVVGVFAGSALWWWLLSGSVSVFRSTLTEWRMRWINWIAAGVIMSFGILALLSLRQLLS